MLLEVGLVGGELRLVEAGVRLQKAGGERELLDGVRGVKGFQLRRDDEFRPVRIVRPEEVEFPVVERPAQRVAHRGGDSPRVGEGAFDGEDERLDGALERGGRRHHQVLRLLDEGIEKRPLELRLGLKARQKRCLAALWRGRARREERLLDGALPPRFDGLRVAHSLQCGAIRVLRHVGKTSPHALAHDVVEIVAVGRA